MTRAIVLAALAGGLGAVALAEVATLMADRPRRGRRRRREGARGAALLGALARAGRRLGAITAPHDLAGRLARAGEPLGLAVAEVMAVKAAATLAGVPAGLALGVSAPGRLGVLVGIAAPLAGFLAPDVWLARRARRRGEAMAREVADVLDLLRVTVEAGLAVPRALEEVGRRRGGALGGELTRAARRNALGVPRGQVLEELVARCPITAVGDLATAITRAERHGAPLAPGLTALALQARAESARRVRDGAARAGPKIQLVVATVLVPAVMLILSAALAQAFLPGL